MPRPCTDRLAPGAQGPAARSTQGIERSSARHSRWGGGSLPARPSIVEARSELLRHPVHAGGDLIGFTPRHWEPVEAPPNAAPIVILPGFGNDTSDYCLPFGDAQSPSCLVSALQVCPLQLADHTPPAPARHGRTRVPCCNAAAPRSGPARPLCPAAEARLPSLRCAAAAQGVVQGLEGAALRRILQEPADHGPRVHLVSLLLVVYPFRCAQACAGRPTAGACAPAAAACTKPPWRGAPAGSTSPPWQGASAGSTDPWLVGSPAPQQPQH